MRLHSIERMREERRGGAWILLLHGVWLQAFLLLGILYLSIPAYRIIYPSCLLFAGLIVWLFVSWKLTGGKLFSPYPLFALAAGLFNGGHLLLEVFHLNPLGILEGRFTDDALLRTTVFILLGMWSLHAGALLHRYLSSHTLAAQRLPLDGKHPDDRGARFVGWGLLILALPFAVLVMQDALEKVLSGNVLALYGNDDPTGFAAIPMLVSKFLIPAALLILAGSRDSRLGIIVSALVVTASTGLNLAMGLRSAAIMPLLAYLWLFDRFVRRLPRAGMIIAGGAVFFILFPLIALLRVQNYASVDVASQFAMLDNPAVAILAEVGNSMLTVAYTLDRVPLVRDYDWGTGYGYALLTVMPNLFWDLHPSVAHGLAADWISMEIDPTYASIGGGYGFSFLAEAYLNFGWYGIALLGLIGYGCAAFAGSAEDSGNPARMAMVACFLSFFLLYARGESAAIIRPLLWYSILPYAAVIVARTLRMRP
jgi:oligosaccharide repeat unit polymerase